jgi:osmotically-inducible protein OsmY
VNTQVVAPPRDLIKSKIEKALIDWARQQATLIAVETDGERVTLAGPVPTNTAERTVVAAVRYLPGVAEIENHLCVVADLVQSRAGTRDHGVC